LLLKGIFVGVVEDICRGTFTIEKLKENRYVSSRFVKKWETISREYTCNPKISIPYEVKELINQQAEVTTLNDNIFKDFYVTEELLEKRTKHLVTISYYLHLAM